MSETDAGRSRALFLLDASLGVIEDRMQVAVVYPFREEDPADGPSESDFGNLEIGVKWRFVNSGRLQMALAPYYAFGVSTGTANKGIGNKSDVAVFPVNAEYQVDDIWRLNGEVSYARVADGENEWGYGAALAYALDDRWELLFEISGSSTARLGTDFIEARAGFDAAINESVHLLFSLGSGLRAPSGEDELDYDIFLGLQFLR